jgi:hypothetical protein
MRGRSNMYFEEEVMELLDCIALGMPIRDAAATA